MKETDPYRRRVGKTVLTFAESSLSPRSFVHHSFPFQFRALEIQKDCNLKAGDIQVSQHLGNVGFIEISYHLWIGDDFSIYNQVGN